MRRFQVLQVWLALGAMVFAAACGGNAGPQPVTPAGGGAPPPPSSTAPAAGNAATKPAPAEAFALPNRPAEQDLLSRADEGAKPIDAAPLAKAAKTKGIGARPATCAAYETRAAAPKASKDDLSGALAENDVGKRDALLVAVAATKPDIVPALRADLAPIECADAITDKKIPAAGNVTGPHAHVLVGLSLASKLSRTALTPPKMEDTADKEKVKAFIKGPLAKWVIEQASAIEALAGAAAGLQGYGRGVAAVEAGIADLRLVDKIRSAPTPKGWDAELKSVYEAALDEALEPRKNRGRDAALVGFSDLAQVGSLHHHSVKSARALLAKLYGGRRIDALDALLLPPWTAAHADAPISAYWSLVMPDLASRTEGVGPRPKGCSASACLAYARARFEMGRTYWRRVDFIEAAHAAKEAGEDPHARLILALALALAQGPNGAKEMMLAPTPAALNLGHVEALDSVAAEGHVTAGMAAFDAAHLKSLSVPEGEAAAAHLRDVAARFKKSAPLLPDASTKDLAVKRAEEAELAASSAASKPKQP
jgi:hypothetical protein